MSPPAGRCAEGPRWEVGGGLASYKAVDDNVCMQAVMCTVAILLQCWAIPVKLVYFENIFETCCSPAWLSVFLNAADAILVLNIFVSVRTGNHQKVLQVRHM